MGSITIKPQEMLFIYHTEQANYEERRTEAQSMEVFVKEMEFKNITPTMWQSLLEWLEVEPIELFDENHPDYAKEIEGKDYDNNGWTTILTNNYELIKFPIAAIDKKAVVCNQRNTMISLFSNKSANRDMKVRGESDEEQMPKF